MHHYQNKAMKLLRTVLLFLPLSVYADTEDRSSTWFMSLSRIEFSDHYRGFLDIQPRFTVDDTPGGDNGSIDTVLIRGALGYQIKPNLGIYQGYAIIPTYDPDKVEHRSFQELLAKQSIGKSSSLAHRLRFEQRFLEGVDDDDIAYRFRYFARFTHPLTGIHEKLSLAINEEVFININDTDGGPKSGFNQNRLFVGLNYRVSKTLAFEAGYQNQFINVQGSADDVVNHIAFFGIQTSFSFID
jgi:Protein of unknown function (DUF2490)